jgi:hypothetical protein
MKKKALIAALMASKAPDDEQVYCWDVNEGARHEITSVDDGTLGGGCLDLNCNEDIDPEVEDAAVVEAQQAEAAEQEANAAVMARFSLSDDDWDATPATVQAALRRAMED